MVHPVVAQVPDGGPGGRAQVQAARGLARVALERSADAVGAPLDRAGGDGFPRDAEGAPRPFGGHWHWSVANTEGLVAAVVAPVPVAIDAEWLGRPRFEAARDHFGEDELACLGGRDRERVLRLWTAKEAVLKLTQRGMADLGRCRLVERPDDLCGDSRWTLEHRGERHVVRMHTVGEHCLSIAGADELELDWLTLEARVSILHGVLPGETEAHRVQARRRLEPIRDEYPFDSHFLDHDGVLQHYLDEGPRDAPVLLFLHGNPTWSFFWRRAVLALRERYRCIVPDHVGCGLSHKPAGYPYVLERHVANVTRLADRLGLEDVTLVLHDWGGAIGMGFARRRPERIVRIAVMNTAAFPSDRMPLRIAACRIPIFGRLAVQGCNAFARAATFMAVERPLHPLVKRGYLLPYDTYDNRRATFEFVQDIPMDDTHPSHAELRETGEALRRFRDRPTLILWGERDWCFTPWFREEWQRRFPNADVHRFEQAGHYLLEDEPEGAVTALADFLERT